MSETKHAFYSATAARHGTVVYARANGEEVTATCVCDDAEGSEYYFDDKVYLGEVTTFVSTTINPIYDTHSLNYPQWRNQ